MVYALIVAGGKGLRMGADIPKQFLPLQGNMVLWHTLNQFYAAFPNLVVVLVLPENTLAMTKEALATLEKSPEQLRYVAGGETRFDSVKNGLNTLPQDGWVMVHDGVRPLVTPSFLQYCLQEAQLNGSAVPLVPVKDSLRWVDEQGTSVIDRSRVMAVQTPQVFPLLKLKQAFNRPYDPIFTDEATVYEAYGEQIHTVVGLSENIKITTPDDLLLAESWLKKGG